MAYIVPIHQACSIRHAIRLSFLEPDSDDLVVAKANLLEIWSSHPQFPSEPTLILRYKKALYGKVVLLHKIRPASSKTEHLFIGTDRYNYFTLSWDAANRELKTEKSYVDIADRSARDSQTGDRLHIDPTARFMTLECYEGVVNVLPIAHAGKGKRKAAEDTIGELGDPIPVRIPELFVRSSCFLHKRSPESKLANPAFAVLYEDSQNQPRIKIRELTYAPSLRPAEEPSTAELEKEKEVSSRLDLGATFLIPLPPPIYGMLLVGDTSVSYIDEWEYRVQDTHGLVDATVFVAWCQIDANRFLLADDYGKLYLLMVEQNINGEYAGVHVDVLGEASRASTLVYLDGGRVFVGSHQGDSQIIQIHSANHMEVVQTFPNIAPILDFAVMDLGNRGSDAPVNEFSSGQARIVTGSGAFKDGSLRSVRSGVGLEDRGDLGSLGAPITSVYSLKSNSTVETVDTLLVSFVSHSRALTFTPDGNVEELETYRGFDLAEPTLYAGEVSRRRAVQVTSTTVLLTDADAGMVTDSWRAPAGSTITAVSADQDTILLSLQGARLVILDLTQPEIKLEAERQFGDDEQVSCICLSSSLPGAAVVGFWRDSKVSILDLKTLNPIASECVAEDDDLAVPRSLIMAKIFAEQPPLLFIGLADGSVVTYTIEAPTNAFAARKSIILGTQQANFAVLTRADGLQNVFATCEHPSLIYGSEGRMVYSAVTAESATCVCSFDSFEPFSNAVAIAAGDELRIAVVDEERTTHVQDLFIHETVRRLAYSPDLKSFALGCIQRDLQAGVEEVTSHVKLVDEVAFRELDSWALKQDELIEALIRCKLDDGSGGEAERFVVGTTYLDDQDANAAKGRIIVLEVTEDRRLKLVTEVNVKGACRCLAMCDGMIVAALIKTVVVFSFEYDTPSTPTMVKKAAYRTATAPIDITVTGNTIAVSDLMKSLSLVRYTRGIAGLPDTLTEIARHFDTLWGTAVAHVAENTYLEADAEGNLLVLQHDTAGFSEDDRRRLQVTSDFGLGEMVNRIRRIDVVATPAAIINPRAFLATVDGSIYLFALIAPARQDLLMRLQAEMATLVRSPGHVPFHRFRAFRTRARDMSEEGPSRFVDGDLVERFLDLPDAVQLDIVTRLKADLLDVRGMIENLRRTH